MKHVIRTILALALAFSAAVAFGQNAGGTLFASTAQTATTLNSRDVVNLAGRSGIVVIDITARTSGTYTFTIQGKDGTSGKYYTILASTALNSTGTTVLKVGPGLTAAANAVVNDNLPMVWRVNVAGASTPVMTFSVGYQTLD